MWLLRGLGRIRKLHTQQEQEREELWRRFFADPTMWWDNRAKKRSDSNFPDFKHVVSGEGLWIQSKGGCPEWVKSKLLLLREPAVAASAGGARAQFKVEAGATEVPVPSVASLISSIKECGSFGNLEGGKKIHAAAVERGQHFNNYVAAALITMYTKCGSMEDAENVFNGVRRRDTGCWNAFIIGCAGNGDESYQIKALESLEKMKAENCEPDSRTYLGACVACGALAAKCEGDAMKNKWLEKAKLLHAQVEAASLGKSSYLGNSLVSMYFKYGSVDHAREVFDKMREAGIANLATWNAMILGCAENGHCQQALKLYSEIDCEVNARTFVVVLMACTELASREKGKEMSGKPVKLNALQKGRNIHSQLASSCIASDVFVGSALINMYAKCGSMVDARKVFEENTAFRKNVVAWNSLLQGYIQNGESEVALNMFETMKKTGDCRPDLRSYVLVLSACGDVMAVETGTAIASVIGKQELSKNLVLATSVIDFHAKCGNMDSAREIFESIAAEKDAAVWNSLISGYCQQGDVQKVLQVFDRMQREGRLKPNAITFALILTTCSHSGMVEEGQKHFTTMSSQYGITPNVHHYSSMVDLLGRANRLEEAFALVRSMPIQADVTVWRSLLGACRKWNNVRVAEAAFESLLKLGDQTATGYVLMAQIYGSFGMWESRSRVLSLKQSSNASKRPGKSWWSDPKTGKVHKFVVGDMNKDDQLMGKIRDRLKEIMHKLKEQGYVADVNSVTSLELEGPNSQEDKEEALCGHSEKLAIGCALVTSPPEETIRIVKNLNCHAATALISRTEERKIICRDASRLHVFEHGKCSCGDYW